MSRNYRPRGASGAWLFLALLTGAVGCGVTHSVVDSNDGAPSRRAWLAFCDEDPPVQVPHELAKVTPPSYVIEPPDILLIDAIRLVPVPPYRIGPLDVLGVQVTNTLPNAPIAGLFSVEPAGTLELGFTYGAVKLSGLTIEEAKTKIEQQLKQKLKPPYEVTVILAAFRAMQLIRGEHLVRPDGTISLGVYGTVPVDGLTVAEAKAAIEATLSGSLQDPEISLDVAGFNSRVYYVIMDGAGAGEQVVRLPCTGKETVLDAISLVGGLPPVSSRNRIWLARPAPAQLGCDQILPIDWVGITQRGQTLTNYQVLPGDRVYVKAAPLITLDTYIARIISPVERAFGITLLAHTVIQELRGTSTTGTGTGG